MQQASVPADHHTTSLDRSGRARAAGIHLSISALVAALAAMLVFAVWYPFPYSEISGGRDLFLLVVAVDVVLGPLITFAIFNRRKPRQELRRDLAMVVVLQVAGLAYGLWTVHLARPVHLVFEYDRFRAVHQVEIPVEELHLATPWIEAIPLGRPTLLSLRPLGAGREEYEYTMAALAGVPVAGRPQLWQPYEAGRARILAAARPVTQLKERFPQHASEIDAALREAGREAARAAYLPLVARKAEAWTVLLDAGTAEVIGYLPLDSF